MALEAGLDLVEVAPNVRTPTSAASWITRNSRPSRRKITGTEKGTATGSKNLPLNYGPLGPFRIGSNYAGMIPIPFDLIS